MGLKEYRIHDVAVPRMSRHMKSAEVFCRANSCIAAAAAAAVVVVCRRADCE